MQNEHAKIQTATAPDSRRGYRVGNAAVLILFVPNKIYVKISIAPAVTKSHAMASAYNASSIGHT